MSRNTALALLRTWI
ncbi:hypothetical protein V1478_008182 [Vespula squamosa]|uniref:Uncharacterized protein n=1 Tax=Vespula squamosa TaxID=30214 RepID=A0ABD2AY19_VESSQ